MSDISQGRFVAVNRDGGAGIVGAQALAQARPDGLTMTRRRATAIAGLLPE